MTGRVILGPHRPCAECAGCVELFTYDPPSGCTSLRDAADLFVTVEHLAGYAAFRPTPRYRSHPPQILQRGQGLAEYALIVAGVALVAVMAVAAFGASIAGTLSAIGQGL